jgi:hypothetical protein
MADRRIRRQKVEQIPVESFSRNVQTYQESVFPSEFVGLRWWSAVGKTYCFDNWKEDEKIVLAKMK